MDRFLMIDGVRVPRFLYGTAWKEERTRELAEAALRAGFRGIDTANQRKHYHEAGVGEALGSVPRAELFLQTKFTFRAGQDHRLPYDPAAPIAEQVSQSFRRSLEHLKTDAIDSYVLHGPMYRDGLASEDWEAWRAMEAVQASGKARLLGVSNVSLGQLRTLCDGAKVPPRFVQNRCYAVTGWDRRVRSFCAERGILYQGFSLLTANRDALMRMEFKLIAQRLGRTIPQVVFRFALEIGMMPLTGTTDERHMRDDLEAFDFALAPGEAEMIESLAER